VHEGLMLEEPPGSRRARTDAIVVAGEALIFSRDIVVAGSIGDAQQMGYGIVRSDAEHRVYSTSAMF
jgi:hypothetical protein